MPEVEYANPDSQRKRSKLGSEHDMYSSLIDKTERDFNQEKGEISNIEQIYKKVFGKWDLADSDRRVLKLQ